MFKLAAVAGTMALFASLGHPALAASEQYQTGPARSVVAMTVARDTGSQAYPSFTGPGRKLQGNTVARDTGSQAMPTFNGKAVAWGSETNQKAIALTRR